MNIFIECINDKPKSNFISKLRYKRKMKYFISNIEKCSPDLGLLWKMADFIKLCEEVYFYDNNPDNPAMGLYSSKKYEAGQNGFKIKDEDLGIIILIKLNSNTKYVYLEIHRLKTGLNTTFSFKNNGEDKSAQSVYSEILIEEVVKIITSKIISLFKYYYNRDESKFFQI